VNLVITDDQYSPSGGVQAAQQCASNNPAPFLITGFAGIDTAPAVRQWAEANHWLYLSPFSTDSGLSKLRYTFEIQPSIEDVGDVLGRYVAKHWPGGSDGVVWRNTSNWQGGRDHFEAIVKARGARITDLPISENQGNYTNEVLALKAARATSALAVMNPTELIQLEKQAAEQNYYPRWINATLDLTTDALGSDIDGSRGPAAIGFWFVPEYHNGDATEPWSPEERAMEAAYHTYDSSHTPNDIDWFNWLTFKQLGRMLRDCGRDCTRNKIAGMFLAGYRTTVNPLCPVDFARGHGKIGSFAMNIAEVVRRTSGVGWQQVESCRDRF
jgi:ABC-type branched-subunit amino acid transport system substrate-binding protein